jgi:hypothetical protein
MACAICLEEGADAPPPCGGLGTPLFHTRCLEMAWASRAACPHCNRVVEGWGSGEAALHLSAHRLRGVLERWFQDASYWIQPPEYVVVKWNGLLSEEENERALAGLQAEVLLLLKAASALQASYNHGESLWICGCVDPKRNARITVSLARTAIVDGLGRFLQDGYSVMAEQRRHLPARGGASSPARRS